MALLAFGAASRSSFPFRPTMKKNEVPSEGGSLCTNK